MGEFTMAWQLVHWMFVAFGTAKNKRFSNYFCYDLCMEVTAGHGTAVV